MFSDMDVDVPVERALVSRGQFDAERRRIITLRPLHRIQYTRDREKKYEEGMDDPWYECSSVVGFKVTGAVGADKVCPCHEK